MDKSNHSQLELFSQEKEHFQTKSTSGISAFFKNIKIYEKRVLLIIAFIFTAVVSFSLGVENGKRSMYGSASLNFDLASKDSTMGNQKISVTQAINPTVKVSTDRKKVKEVSVNRILASTNILILPQETTNIRTNSFTIQLATYKTKTFAQREADTLKNKGLSPIVLSRSGYSVLCVGSFVNRESAQSLLSQLKKSYPDCLIRRL